MRIGIDARLYGLKNRGLGRYVKNLVDRLPEDNNEYIVFLLSENFNEFSSKAKNIKKVLLPARWYGLKEQWLVNKMAKKEKIDLMHFTHLNVPYFYSGKFIVTIHDLTINRFPDSRATTLPYWLYLIKFWAYKKIIKHALDKAKQIICPSNFVKRDLINFYHTRENKINVLYEGVDFKQKETANQQISGKVTKPYILYVGAAYPHKNLEFLIKSFILFNKDNTYELVLVGRTDFFYERLIKDSANQKNIVFWGEASDENLINLYRNCLFFVFPSLNEGFGLPPLEAQNCGAAVLSSNSSCLPEILGESALYFNPIKVEDLMEKMKELSQNQDLKNRLVNLGNENYKHFSWDKMAKETCKLYQN